MMDVRSLLAAGTLMLGLAVVVSAETPGASSDEVMFHEDFEDGASDAWLRLPPEMELVADPDDADNRVASLPRGRHTLAGPPVRLNDWKAARERDEQMDQWRDYELSFRFRLERAVDIPEVAGQPASFLDVAVRINPNEDHPGEHRLMYLTLWRPELRWHVRPHVRWYSVNTRFDEVYSQADRFREAIGTADTQWHTVRVICVGDEMAVYFDDVLAFHGRDERVVRGGFSVGRWDSEPARVDLGNMYLDDITVRAVDAAALPNKEHGE